MTLKERYIATLQGCAYGDALGMSVEGWKRERIQKYVGKITRPIAPVIIKDDAGMEIKKDEFGELKYWTRGLNKGDWTDDTIFTAVIAGSIAQKHFLDLNDIALRHVELYRALPAGAYGDTTREALENLAKGISPLESGVIGGPGNAPPMKMSSLGLYMDATGLYEEGLDFAEKVGRMTHRDPRSVVAGVLQAHAIYTLLKEDTTRNSFVTGLANLCESWEKPLTEEYTWHRKGNLSSRIGWIEDNLHIDNETAFKTLGSSSAVYQSYLFALWMFQKYGFETPEKAVEGLIETINFGGDCDTTGAIYGTLIGARHGHIFPKSWGEDVRDLDKLEWLAEEIYSLKNI